MNKEFGAKIYARRGVLEKKALKLSALEPRARASYRLKVTRTGKGLLLLHIVFLL